jgi:hypothetical protein
MQIEINSISTSFTKTAKGGYSTAEVDYTDEGGRPKKKKIMSFANPKVFDTLKGANPGDVFQVTEKQDGQYTNWATIEASSAADRSAAKPTTTGSASVGYKPEYETRDERNARQRSIIRQSCLAQAVAWLNKDTDVTREDVLETADTFVAWVTQAPGLVDEPNDIPF